MIKPVLENVKHQFSNHHQCGQSQNCRMIPIKNPPHCIFKVFLHRLNKVQEVLVAVKLFIKLFLGNLNEGFN